MHNDIENHIFVLLSKTIQREVEEALDIEVKLFYKTLNTFELKVVLEI